MKKLKNISILLLISPLLEGCPLPDQGFSEIDYTIFNQTDKNVKVFGFDRQLDLNTNGKADQINILPNSEYSVRRISGIDDNTIMSFFSLNGGVDSVRVVFNNEKVKVYIYNPNPCEICNGDENHQYYITEEDYNSAVECNGDCD